MSSEIQQQQQQRPQDDTAGVMYTNARQSIRCIRDSTRIVRGDASATPSPYFARSERLGLLFTLNRKNAIVNQRVESEQTSLREVPELSKLVQFLGFITSGIVAETERVDESLLQAQEAAIRVGREIKILDTKLQALKLTPQSSLAERAIAERFPSRIVIRQSVAKKAAVKSADIPDNLREEADDLANRINDNRAQLAALGDRIRVLAALQNLMHGTHRTSGAMSNAEVISLVDEISLPSTLRRSIHVIRDLSQSSSRVSQEEFDELPALKILREFLQFVDAGISAILDDLFRAQLRLKKAAAIEDITVETQKLHEQNERNKMEKQMAIENISNTLDATMFSTSRNNNNNSYYYKKQRQQQQQQQGNSNVSMHKENGISGDDDKNNNEDDDHGDDDDVDAVVDQSAIHPQNDTTMTPAAYYYSKNQNNNRNSVVASRNLQLPPNSTKKVSTSAAVSQQQQNNETTNKRKSKDSELESFLSEFCA